MNFAARDRYWNFYNNYKDKSEQDLNHEICRLWKKESKGWKRPPMKGEKNFAFVNGVLEGRGCHEYARDTSDGPHRTHYNHTDSSTVSSSDCDAPTFPESWQKRSEKKSELQKEWREKNELKRKAKKHGERKAKQGE